MTEVEGMNGIVHTFQEYKKENNMHYFEESLENLLKKYDNEEIAILNLIAKIMDVLNNNYVKEYTAFLYTNGGKLSDEARNLAAYYSITEE
jgi:hypothetical protein